MPIRARAFLRLIRNNRRGLLTRSRVIEALTLSTGTTTRSLMVAAELRYRTVLHHLRLMKAEGIVKRMDEGKWVLTELGQQSIEEYIESNH